MKTYLAALAAGVVLVGGCKDNPVVNPLDAPTAAALQGSLTRTGLQTLVTGILAQDRSGFTGNGATYPVITAIWQRDAYRVDASEPRYVNETLGGTPDPGSFAGGGGWTPFYVAIRAENTTLQALAKASTTQFSAAELNATRGFVRTLMALDYYRIAELRDTLGIAMQNSDPDKTTPDPIVCKTNALTYIAALLDSAYADLQAAGNASLPFSLPSGFTAFGRDYTLASNIILFNRGLKGKIDFYRGMDHQKPNAALFTTAIAELTQALGGAAPGAVDPTTFGYGPYHVFVPSGTEAAPNPFPDPKLGLNPAVHDSIQAGDTRSSKIVSRSKLSGFGISTTWTEVNAVSTNAANYAAPIGILRDEELVLLRAQAEFEAGQYVQGTADLNSVRTHYGLAPYALFTDITSARSAVLYEKRYSLLFEGPQRLVDLRAYGRLNNTWLPKELPTDPFNSAFPIPKAEADARKGNVTPTCS